jgi:hypothetical protein
MGKMSESNEKVITINCHPDYCSQRECASNFCTQIHYFKSVQEQSALVAEKQLRTRETDVIQTVFIVES